VWNLRFLDAPRLVQLAFFGLSDAVTRRWHHGFPQGFQQNVWTARRAAGRSAL